MWKSFVVLSVAVLSCAAAFVASASEDPKPAKADAPKFGIRWEGSVIAARPVKDLEASIRWYQDVLGCGIYLDLRQMGWVELTTPVANTLVGLSQQDPASGAVKAGDSKLMFGTKDIVEAKAWLEKKGVKTQPIVEIPQTVKLMSFQDPDGHWLEFHQPWSGEK